MKHSELKSGDIVVFKMYCDILKREDFWDGYVVFVNEETKKVCISYLEGYKDRHDYIDYDKVVAKYDDDGEYMQFGNISGNSVLLN